MLPFPKLLTEFKRYVARYGRVSLEQFVTNESGGALRLTIFTNPKTSSVSAKLIWGEGRRTFEGRGDPVEGDKEDEEPWDEYNAALQEAFRDCGSFFAAYQARASITLPEQLEFVGEYPDRATALLPTEVFKHFWIHNKLVPLKDYKGDNSAWVWIVQYKGAVPPPMPKADEKIKPIANRSVSPEASLDHERLSGLSHAALKALFIARELGRVGTIHTKEIPDYGTNIHTLRFLEKRLLVDVIPKEDHPDGPYAVLTKKGANVAQYIPPGFVDFTIEPKRIRLIEKQRESRDEIVKKRK